MRSLIVACAAVLAVALAGSAKAGQTFDAVKARGTLNCGVNTGLNGFSAPDDKGNWSGLDVDQCRGVAAALFGDATKVKYVPLTAQQRFTALQSGEIDMLSRNTTINLTRETANGLLFAFTDFYDGQGFLVAKKLGVKSVKDLNGASVCVQTGTDTQLTMADYARAHGIEMKPVTIDNLSQAVSAFLSGRCDSFTSDSSQLASVRAFQTPSPDDYLVLPELISREPLATAVRQGDDQWYNVVKWVGQAMLVGEQKGVTSANVDQMMTSTDPEIRRLLGVTPGMGKNLGLDEKWAYNVIKQVGNYQESFDRNVGANSKMKLDRGLNGLWDHGGLMYPLPVQ
jgi:general L-amino acid transport system substrate-binding protein